MKLMTPPSLGLCPADLECRRRDAAPDAPDIRASPAAIARTIAAGVSCGVLPVVSGEHFVGVDMLVGGHVKVRKSGRVS